MAKNKTLTERARRIKTSYETLKEAMPVIGETAGVGEGLEALAGKVKTATVLTPDMELTVSSAGGIYPEDSVAITYEPEKVGEAVKLATGGAKLLGVEEITSNLAVVCFAQDSKTYIKAARLDPQASTWTLGPTCVLVERELDKVVMVSWGNVYSQGDSRYSVAVFYREEDAGMVQFWEISWPSNAVHKGTDIWTDQVPTNFCGAWTPVWKTWETDKYSNGIAKQNLITIAFLAGDGSIRLTGIAPTQHNDSETDTYYYSAEIWAEKTILPGEEYTGAAVYEPLEWTNRNGGTATEPIERGKHDDFTVAPPDAQEYMNSAWNLTSGLGRGVMWLTYPGADGERYALEIWCMTDTIVTPEVEYKYAPAACRKLLQKGYQSCGAGFYGIKNSDDADMGKGPYFFGVLARLSGQSQKTGVGMENWCGGYDYKFTPLRFGEEDQSYGENIGLLDVCAIEPNMMAVGYAAENVYRMFLVGKAGRGVVLGGPAAEITGVGTAAYLKHCGDGAALCYQKGSDVFLQYVQAKLVVTATKESRFAVGQAVTGGRPGQIIKVKRLE